MNIDALRKYLTRLAFSVICGGIILAPFGCAVRMNGVGEPDAGVEQELETCIPVWYATLREKKDTLDVSKIYGAERSGLGTGIGIVKFEEATRNRKAADTQTDRISDEPSRVTDVNEIQEERFWEEIASFAKEGGKIVLYVHGYNTDFEQALQQAAFFQHALNSNQRVLLFSWPAGDDLLKYTRDEENLEWSVPRIAQVLQETILCAGKGKLDVAAHSMGAKGVVQALYEISRDASGEPLLNNLVLIAPDIDTDRFRDIWPDVRNLVLKTTLYVSESDRALKISQRIHGYPRLGEAGEYLSVLPGIETIDVSELGDFRPSGHLYHLYNPDVVADLAVLLSEGQQAGGRSNMEPAIQNDAAYWKLMPK